MRNIFSLEGGSFGREWDKLELLKTLDACNRSLAECARRFIKAIDAEDDRKAYFYDVLYGLVSDYMDRLLLPNAKAPTDVMHERTLIQCIFDAQKEVVRLFTPDPATAS